MRNRTPFWTATVAMIISALALSACGAQRPTSSEPPPGAVKSIDQPPPELAAVTPPPPPGKEATAAADDITIETYAGDPSTPLPPPAPTPSPVAAPPPPTPPPTVALPDNYEIVSNVLLPTESYLPKSDGMPTGLVLLDSRETSKNESLCKALLGTRTATVRTEAAARRDNPRGDYLVTHWPVKATVANEGNCGLLYDAYDFDRAKRVKQAYALQDRRGPLFLALDPTGEIVFLDLEDASSQEVFKATGDWMALALAAPQSGPNAGKPPQSLMAGANKLFAKLASGFSSLVGGGSTVTTVRFNDPVAGTSRQFNIYKSGVYLIGATFVL